jgi:hypothetical protein
MRELRITLLICSLLSGASILNAQTRPGILNQPSDTPGISESDLRQQLRDENERLKKLVALLEAKIKVLEDEAVKRSK